MEQKVFSIKGEQIRNIELSDEVFACDVSEASIYYAIRNELANKRVGTASTRTRGEVAGSTIKLYKQKGTGNARSGSVKSPVRVGGGTIFGPKPRDYSYNLPKKVKHLAFRSILSLKGKEDRLKIVEDFTIESKKTKDLVAILKNLGKTRRTVLVLGDDNQEIKQAARNIAGCTFLSANRLRAHDLFYGQNIILLESAAKKLDAIYGAK